MQTLTLAAVSPSPCSAAATPFQPWNAKSFSCIQDIGELLRFNCSQKLEKNKKNQLFRHRRVNAGEPAYRLGQSFGSLYVVRFGFLKTMLRSPEGDERIISFPMQGNLLGAEGICHNCYGTEAIALTDSELIVIPFNQLLASEDSCRELEKMIQVAISREFTEEHAGISLSSPLKSETRVARFLEELAKRYAILGYSPQELLLPMTRRDIGCYLGLTLETVSRSLSALASVGIISVHRQNIQILRPTLLYLFQSPSPTLQRGSGVIRTLPLARSMPSKKKPTPWLRS